MNKVLGFERINERVKRPNALINFIKPLEGQDKELAQDFLERVAAICYPIMKANHIVVMSLEEYPPNPEFVGRNFNAGEVIQLVLKSPGTKQWLPFKHVQMVMMHELAHCKQMNHSKFFWQVRNSYADELKALWSKSYTGEGLWGRGQTLLSGRYMTEHMPDAESEPRSLCGGTYRRQGRKRKRVEVTDKPKVSYAERQQRRIAKKFGVAGLHGVALGDDEYTRNQLEKNRYNPTKPRVAKSKRGRELRAAAALARFETNKTAEVKPEQAVDTTEDDETETESEGEELGGSYPENNPHMVRVCGDEDPKDDDAQHEMRELHDIDQRPRFGARSRTQDVGKQDRVPIVVDDVSTASEDEEDTPRIISSSSTMSKATKKTQNQDAPPNKRREPLKPPSNQLSTSSRPINITPAPEKPSLASSVASSIPTPQAAGQPCPICSLENVPGAATCIACFHVLDISKIPSFWRCISTSCSGSEYRNLGDYGRCGLCGAAKPDL